MQPDQPAPTGDNPYQFIFDPGKPEKKSMLPNIGGSGNAWLVKLGLIIGGAILLMVVAAIVVNVFFGSKSSVDTIVSLAQTEVKITSFSARTNDITDQTVKNAVANTLSTVESHKQHWLTYLENNGRKLTDKELELTDAAITKQLDDAKQANTFDSVLTTTMRSQLTKYAAAIKSAYESSGKDDEKKILSDQYADVLLLLKQWPESP